MGNVFYGPCVIEIWQHQSLGILWVIGNFGPQKNQILQKWSLCFVKLTYKRTPLSIQVQNQTQAHHPFTLSPPKPISFLFNKTYGQMGKSTLTPDLLPRQTNTQPPTHSAIPTTLSPLLSYPANLLPHSPPKVNPNSHPIVPHSKTEQWTI